MPAVVKTFTNVPFLMYFPKSHAVNNNKYIGICFRSVSYNVAMAKKEYNLLMIHEVYCQLMELLFKSSLCVECWGFL